MKGYVAVRPLPKALRSIVKIGRSSLNRRAVRLHLQENRIITPHSWNMKPRLKINHLRVN